MLTGRQIREARALLGLSPSQLAVKVRTMSTATIVRAELVDGEPPITVAHAIAIRQALERAGIEFVSENGGGAGVRLRKTEPS